MLCDHRVGDYSGRRVTVMGLGLFGGGTAVTRFLAERGALLTVTDTRPPEELAESIALLDDLPICWKLGGHQAEDFVLAELLVVNPAVPPTHPFLQLAAATGVPRTSEMNLFWQLCPCPIIGVTGSNGKSTTTALTATMLEHAGKTVWLGGNLGRSLLPELPRMQPGDLAVLELSSFMLADLNRLQSSPQVAVVTNFSPNHLDWHPSLADYRTAKQTILRWQTPSDTAILNADDSDVANWPTGGHTEWFSTRPFDVPGRTGVAHNQSRTDRHLGSGLTLDWPVSSVLQLPGRHNLSNALAASLAASAAGATWEAITAGLSSYRALPHRLEFVATVAGRSFYNDSLATTPESAIAALQSFDRPIVLLAGGYDKQTPLADFAAQISQRVRSVALMGQTGPLLQQLIDRAQQQGSAISSAASHTSGVNSAVCSSFAEAFDWAVATSQPGDVVLLSPGCASYGWFRNFADRGDQFRTLVAAYAKRMESRVG